MTSPAPRPAPAPNGAVPGGPAAYPMGAGPGFVDPGSSRVGAAGDRFGYAPAGVASPVAADNPAFPGSEYVDMHAVFSGGGYTSPKPITNPVARVALWLAVAGIFLIPIPVSIVLAIIGLVRSQDLPERIGAHEAIAALVFNGILVAFGVMVYILGFR